MREKSQAQILATRLKALILAVAALVLGLEGWYFVSAREHALKSAEVTTANLARSLSQHAQDTFEMADLALSGLADALSIQNPFTPDRLHLLNQVMANEVAVSPRLRGLFVYDDQGNWIASSLPVLPSQMNNSDRAYFQHHRGSVSSASFIGQPVRSRSTGEWIITVTRRFDKPDGSFGGVVLASVPTSYFAEFYRRFDIGSEGTVALLNADGTLYARLPYNENIVGSSLASSPLFLEHLSRSSSGAYRYSSAIDGVERVSGYRLGSRFPIVTVVAMGQDEVLTPWWRDVLVRGCTVTIFVLLLGLLGWRLAQQIARRQEVEADLARLAATDALTGLCNRRAFDEALEKEWARSSREGTPLSLVLIDVDHFKQFNDRYGHQAGDAALQAVAAECRKGTRRPADVAARYGGEELALILPNTDAAGAGVVAESTRRGVEALALPHDAAGAGAVVTVSLGCATLRPPRDNTTMEPGAIIRMADRALYEAKSKGRNRVAAASPVAAVAPLYVAASRA